MMCQNCNNKEATNSFVINFMGVEHEVHLCDECTHGLRQWAGGIHRQMMAGGTPPPWWQMMEGNSQPLIPGDAGGDVRSRRRLNQLRDKLERAVEAEQYELAARLRDEIRAMEKEMVSVASE